MKIKNINAGYFPNFILTGQAQYQSDVTKIDIPPQLPIKITVPSKDQYRIGLNVNQLIWDGGTISNAKLYEEVSGQINNFGVATELFKLNQKITDLFFDILGIDIRLKQLDITKTEMQSRLRLVNSKVESGVMLPNNSYILETEIIKIERTVIELLSLKKTLSQSLSEFIGRKVEDDIELEIPDVNVSSEQEPAVSRPEYDLFAATRKNIENGKNLSESKYFPKFYLYGQAVYAKPGLNMFNPDFTPYYILGVKADWNIWNWNSSGREREILTLQEKITISQEETFTKNLKPAIIQLLNETEKLKKIIEKDEEIVGIYDKIVRQVTSQLDNGTITSTDFLTEFNNQAQAMLNAEQHKLELVRSKVNYLNLIGKFIKN